MRQPLRQPHPIRMSEIENWIETATYIIHKDGANTVVIDGATGKEIIRSSDASTAIQYALDDISAGEGGGAQLFFKCGTYELDTELAVSGTLEGVSFIGEVATFREEGPILKATSAMTNMITATSEFFRARDIQFDGNANATNGIKLSAYDAVIQYVAVKGCNVGIKTAGNTWIRNCWIEYNDVGVHTLSTVAWVWLTENIFYFNGKQDVEIDVWEDGYEPWWFIASKNKHVRSDNGYYLHSGAGTPDGTLRGGLFTGNCFWAIGRETDGTVHDNCYFFGDGLFEDIVIVNNIARGKDSAGNQYTADFIEFDGNGTYTDIIVANNRVRDMSANYVNGAANVTRLLLDGLGYTAGVPGVAGDWTAGGYEGLIIRDTTNNKTYIYADGAYREISAA